MKRNYKERKTENVKILRARIPASEYRFHFLVKSIYVGLNVPTSTNSLVALMNMVEQWRAKTDYGPVCVVSPDGRSRAGVYCAANACIEQVIQHGEVDIFQAVKTVRRHRPQLVENMMEYKYCYDLVLHYVLHYLNKDLKEKKFIEFGRGKVIPLTPDSSTDLPNEICNTGKIVVKKRIPKIEKGDSIQLSDNALRSANGKILQRKKKGRLYSLGGNEPMKKPRGRLDRLKTVGTFDLGTEMSVLSEVARNLNEKIISGDIDMAGSSGITRRLSTIPAVSSNDLQGLSTPECGRREIQESNSSHSSHSSKRNVSKVDGSRTIVYFDQHSSDLNNRKHKFNGNNLSHTKMQHSADDCLDKPKASPNNQKSRSLSSSSCLTRTSDKERTAQINFVNRCNNNKSPNIDTNMVFISIKDSNMIPSIDSPEERDEDKEKELTSTDSNKIELDMQSAEDINKIDDEITFKNRPRKPMLRKSKRIVRTDSEIFDENIICRNQIVLQTNLDIQIHKEPDYYFNSESASTTHGSRIASSDIEDNICSPKDLQKSTDESSRNLSTDELDTVFSDTTDLERLDREYRELARSSLQREYKSDGDSLDEVGKKRNEFLKWKNQSFENDFELYNENLNPTSEMICSPDGQVTSTTNTSENSSAKCIDASKRPRRNCEMYPQSRTASPKESDNSTLTSPIRAPSACTEKSSTNSIENTRPTKLEVAQNPPPKESAITSLFEKRFGKIKKINKLLKCKRFSASALYDKKKASDIELKSNPQKVENPSKAKSCSPAKTTDSKSSIHSSKMSLFHPKSGKSSIFSIRKSPMFSNASHSNTELNTRTSSRTKLNELSKSNFEINNFKSSPSRFSTKRSVKESKNNSTACLYKEQKHSPLSEEFYNKTGSVRLSAMELYEKFCSEDFGGLYKNESNKNADDSCGGYKNWHKYRLGHKGLGAAKKYARGKNARLLRQKSEPKFSFRDGSDSRGDIPYFPEEEYEDIYEENGNDECNEEEEETDEYEDEDEDEEGDYYEDECEEEQEYEEEEELDEQEEMNNVADVQSTCVSEIDGQEENIDEEYEGKAYHSEIEDRGDIDLNIGADSDVDEIFLMPAPKADNYDEYGFENKHFTLEQSLLNRSNGIESNLNELSEICADNDFLYPVAQDTREIESFGSDEILTIYKICSKDDILNMKDEKIHKTVSAQECLNTASITLERAVNEYIRNAPPDIEVELEPSIYIERSESFCTLTEFDTVRNMNLDSSSASKLSLSLKSEIFDDFTLTPDEQKVVMNCDFEDFTLTPEGSFSEAIPDAVPSATCSDVLHQHVKNDSVDSEDLTRKDESITSNEVMMIVDKFLANEKLLHQTINQSYEEMICSSTSNDDQRIDTEVQHVTILPSNENPSPKSLDSRRHQSFSSTYTEEKSSIVDMDDESIKNVVSAFTSEITKEFDLLFSRAQLENDDILVVEEPSTDDKISVEGQPSPQRMPSRYSMQRLEPYFIAESENAATHPSLSNSSSVQTEYCKVLDVHDGSFIHKRVISKLKKNRSQSLG
ncbi:Receptor-type tyrosine-protein phosphatase U [Pseudolycoriella hygida]|uniref:protein-tyrosine-phosphatase n=1 Tax=Pseudolycoriella hygida TaxID=35572 RepID=A0A9Q0N2M4_9DIPT|nr:Receptor-type tyrosine-protein phosphatase U [Pseudolycoriella hygida]